MCDDMQQGQGAHRSGQDPNMQIPSPSMSPSSLVVQLLCHILYDTPVCWCTCCPAQRGRYYGQALSPSLLLPYLLLLLFELQHVKPARTVPVKNVGCHPAGLLHCRTPSQQR